jgi:Cyclin-dependent kinase inhibitor 3 (CDKN3)
MSKADPTHGARTSVTHPIRVDWIDPAAVPSAGWKGRLGMTFLPGKRYRGWSGHLHERDLDMDLDRLRGHWGVDTLVLLVEDHEFELTRTTGLVAEVAAHAIDLVRFPIRDTRVPVDPLAVQALLDDVQERLRAAEDVAVACLGGLGRTGTVVACLLIDAGLSVEDAIALTRATRHGTIENADQEAFVHAWRPSDRV